MTRAKKYLIAALAIYMITPGSWVFTGWLVYKLVALFN